MSIGERIKELMRERRVSSKELARLTETPASTIAQWINYNQTPKPEALLRVAKVLGVSIEYLITGEHPEANFLKEAFAAVERQFVEVHTGIYRVRIEKQIEVPAKLPKERGGK